MLTSLSRLSLAILSVSVMFCAMHAPAEGASCGGLALIASTNERYYVVTFQAAAPASTSFDLTLYTKSAVLEASLRHVTIDKPFMSLGRALFRSAAIVLLDSGKEPLLAATAEATDDATHMFCGRQDQIIDSASSMTAPDREVEPDQAALEQELAIEAGDGSNAVALSSSTAKPPPCAVPFAEATVIHAATPAYPKNNESTGTALIEVDLDSTGALSGTAILRSSGNAALDAAAKAAALKSTFRPAIFACQAQRGTYIFRADFEVDRDDNQ